MLVVAVRAVGRADRRVERVEARVGVAVARERRERGVAVGHRRVVRAVEALRLGEPLRGGAARPLVLAVEIEEVVRVVRHCHTALDPAS